MTTHLHADDPAGALRLAGREALVDHRGDGSARDDFDALADLFLGAPGCAAPAPRAGDDAATAGRDPSRGRNAPHTLRLAREDARLRDADSPQASAEPPEPPTVEALILSHLPVTAGPWAAQYAAALERARRRPVALLTLLADHTTVRLFGAEGGAQASGEAPASSLEAAIDIAAAHNPIWLVRADAVREAQLLRADALTGVTILTGADEAATIAAYRALKGVRSALESQDRAGANRASVRVGVVGAPPERSSAALASLTRAVKTFLDCPLEEGLCVASMTPTRSATIYEAESPCEPSAALAAVRASQLTDSDAGPDQRSQETSAMRLDSLAGLLDPPLAALPMRCPHEKHVELALDHAGALHLLVRKSPRAFEAAAIVRAWACQHGELLEAATRRAISGADSALLHIFVESARDARRLLEASCAVHLLVHRRLRGEEILFAVDL